MTSPSASDRAAIAAMLRRQRDAAAGLGAPFYERLLEFMANDADTGGSVAAILAPFADRPFEDAYALRLLGGVHRFVLDGRADALAAHYPSVGGDGDADAAAVGLIDLLESPPPEVLDALERPPQTNEVGRSVALASGLLVVGDRARRPLRLRELGSSAGLNLRLDSYWYAQGDEGWGNPEATVRFVDQWPEGAPPFRAHAEIVERRGCDRDPIDATTDQGRLTLLAYVWPQPAARFERTQAAIAAASLRPVVIDRADVGAWLPEQLEPVAGTTLVVMHSITWQYLSPDTRASVESDLRGAGARATRDAPLAWLRLEPCVDQYSHAELRLDLWDGSTSGPTSELLATSGFHGGALQWLAS